MMQWKNTEETYGAVAKFLHWGMALLIISVLGLGLYMTNVEPSPDVFALYGWHKSLGFIVLVCVFIRLLWKGNNKKPRLPLEMSGKEKLLAHLGHYVLYLLMLGVPLSGWLMSSSAGFPVAVFDWFVLPDIIGKNADLRPLFAEAHELMAYALMGMIGLHIVAALQHHFIRKDDVLKRMLPCVIMVIGCGFPQIASASEFWSLAKEKSNIVFTATLNNAPVQGKFTDIDAEIFFDTQYPESSSVRFAINLMDIQADYEEVAVTLKKPEWFDAELFPQAIFEASNFKPLGNNKFSVDGALTLRLAVVPVTVTFTFEQYSDHHAKAIGTAMLKRSDFKIGQGEWADTKTLKDEVQLDFVIEATR